MRATCPMSLVFSLALLSCTTPRLMQPPGESSIQAADAQGRWAAAYVNHTYRCTVRFPEVAGWQFLTDESEIVELGNLNAIFVASNSSRLLFLILSLEDKGVQMSNADYQVAVKMGASAGNPGLTLEDLSLEETIVNGNEALIWIFNQDDQLTHVHAFFSRGTANYRLMVFTPTEAFERRRDEIEAIIYSFDFL